MKSRPIMNTTAPSQDSSSRPGNVWFVDIIRIWCGDHLGWNELSVVVDCSNPRILSWRLSPKGDSHTVEGALQDSLTAHFGKSLESVDNLIIESYRSTIFSSRHYKELLERLGISHIFSIPQPSSSIDSYVKSAGMSLSETIQRSVPPCASLDDIRQMIRHSPWTS